MINQRLDLMEKYGRSEVLQPRTYFKELAEYGVLEEYIRNRFSNYYQSDPVFKDYIDNLLVQYAKSPVCEIEKLVLEPLNESLDIFLESTWQWRQPKQ